MRGLLMRGLLMRELPMRELPMRELLMRELLMRGVPILGVAMRGLPMLGLVRNLVIVLALALVVAPASAQPRRSELELDLPLGGVATRDLGFVQTRDVLHPSFGLGLRVLGRLARHDDLELHLGARLAATAWRTDTLRRREGAFRTTFDPGLALRGEHGRYALTLTAGPTFALPAIAELFSGVRVARGMHFELALGIDHAVSRLRLGVEVTYTHHRLRASTPDALTTTHLIGLRFAIGVAARDAPP